MVSIAYPALEHKCTWPYDAVKGMEAALAAGITPRKSRLLRGLAAFGALFTVGFGLAYLRDAIDTAAGTGPPMM